MSFSTMEPAQGGFRCAECPDNIHRVFFTVADLFAHKLQRIDQNQGHLQCHICKHEFHTGKGIKHHYQTVLASSLA